MLPALAYSNELVFALDTAQAIARDFRHHVYSGSHLLEAILHEDVGLAEQLEGWGVDVPYLREWASIRLSKFPKAMQAAAEPGPDAVAKKVLEVADVVRLKLGDVQITPLAVLVAICRPGLVFTEEQLRTFPITENELISFKVQNSAANLDQVLQSDNGATEPGTRKENTATATQNLFKFCVDKTALARAGKIDPIIGRDGEVRMMAEILSRRTKPNVMIVGEPGVGKTALVEGFALKIINEEVPGRLKNATVMELDVGSLVAGASYKGEVEDRLKKIIKEVKLLDRAILFIDEIHMLLDPRGSVGSGAANLLKPELARGELTVIGATTNDEFRKYVEKDEAFSRRFEKLKVEEPNTETAIRMLQALLPKYEQHHELAVEKESLEEAVKLAQRYLRERSLPDTAVDLMDRTMAAIRLMGEGSDEVIEALEKELNELEGNRAEADPNGFFKDLQWFQGQMHQRLSPILTNQVEEEDDEEELARETPEKFKTYLQNRLAKIKELAREKITSVLPHHIAAIVSYSTGIPLGKIQTKEREKLLNMHEAMGKRVIGQSHALEIVTDAVQIARSGIKEPGKPVGSFFFLGPTGTGKTELAKSIANFLFNDETALIRFDMSEFKESHSEAALLGAPPGYVGYEEGGPLINKIRQQPYSVVLFDEIEKANKAVFDVFLQILDEGKATDRLGKEGDFSNSIILFTSNIGSQHVVEEFNAGRIPEENELKKIMANYFRPEFLGRVGNIIPFSPITEEIMLQIFDIHLNKLAKLVEAQGIRMSVSEQAKKQVAMAGFSPEFGARPLISVIRTQLSRPISKMLIKGELKAGDNLEVDWNEEEQKLDWKVN